MTTVHSITGGLPGNLTPDVPIAFRIMGLVQEQNRLFSYPLEYLAEEIRATGFRCTCCGACCTQSVGRHIFLLDHDVTEARKIDPRACEPAPDPEFCDQNGILYVSGYALRMKDDAVGSCWFLEDGRCRIYERRFSGCRIYPHLLRRVRNPAGTIVWQKFARRNEHGCFDLHRSSGDCLALASEVKEYENAFLTQQISFLETVQDHFTAHDLRYDPVMHREGLQRIRAGRPVRIEVFCAGQLVNSGL